jgi:hypothetical protein
VLELFQEWGEERTKRNGRRSEFKYDVFAKL